MMSFALMHDAIPWETKLCIVNAANRLLKRLLGGQNKNGLPRLVRFICDLDVNLLKMWFGGGCLLYFVTVQGVISQNLCNRPFLGIARPKKAYYIQTLFLCVWSKNLKQLKNRCVLKA